MKITLGASPMGITDMVTFDGDNITITPAALDGWGNCDAVPDFPPLGIFRYQYTHVMAWDTTDSGQFAVIRIVNDEPIMIPIEGDPFELRVGDAILFGNQPSVFILWVEGYALLSGDRGVIPREEWIAIYGDE